MAWPGLGVHLHPGKDMASPSMVRLVLSWVQATWKELPEGQKGGGKGALEWVFGCEPDLVFLEGGTEGRGPSSGVLLQPPSLTALQRQRQGQHRAAGYLLEPRGRGLRKEGHDPGQRQGKGWVSGKP